jgi:two-component system, OmpR family, phosphate regulon sensor histidine kinase PhoR
MLTFEQLAKRIEERVGHGAAVPLLVVRCPEFARSAASACFYDAARCVVRRDDSLANAPGTDRFAIALLAPPRSGSPPDAQQVLAALDRIGASITIAAELERGNGERGRGAMLAAVGHELRAPLTSIRGYLETLLDGELDPSTTRRFLETARREALRLGRLVDGMLEFSLLDLSARRSIPVCDVVEQVRMAVESAAPLAAARSVHIRVTLPSSARARVDGDACVHAIANLIENAVKHGCEGGSVEISCVCEACYTCIAVDDDGPGIEPVERESIFRIGVRGPGRPGSGIGLAVVHAVAERAGGDVQVEQSPRGGARFVLRFPAG